MTRQGKKVRGGNRFNTRWRGKLPVPLHTHPLVRRLFQELNSQNTTITEIAERAGFRRGTISDWRYRQEPRISDLDAVLNVLGLQLTVRRRQED